MDNLNTLLTVPAIVAIVNLAKQFGITGKWATVLAVAVGVGVYMASYYWSASGWFPVAVTGLLIGLSAAGLYDVARAAAPKE